MMALYRFINQYDQLIMSHTSHHPSRRLGTVWHYPELITFCKIQISFSLPK